MENDVLEIEGPAEEAKGDLESLINNLIGVVKHVYEKVSALEDLVVNQFIGGINGLYDENQRAVSVGDLRGKFGDLFKDLMPAYLEENDGVDDIFDRLHELTSGLRGSEGADAAIEAKVKEVADALRKRFTSLREKIPELKAAVVQAEPAPEPAPAPPPEKSAEDELIENIRKEKKRRPGYTGTRD